MFGVCSFDVCFHLMCVCVCFHLMCVACFHVLCVCVCLCVCVFSLDVFVCALDKIENMHTAKLFTGVSSNVALHHARSHSSAQA